MTEYYGDFAEDDTVLIPFNTFDSNDPSASVTITNLADSDLHVHKDGGTTQITTDGATIAINFDGITGNHLATIDTSAHADYSTGSEYAVRMEGTTVDGATINAWIGAFSIERAGGALAVIKLIQTAVITNAAGADVAADIIAVKAETALIVADTNELQADWVNGGRLDLLLDAIPTTAMRGTDSAATAANLATVDTNVDSILVDTAEIGTAGAGLTNINLPNQTMDITGNLSGSVGSVTGAVGSVAGNVDGSVASNVELGPSEVNAEVVDVIRADTVAEISGVPAATSTMMDKINWLFTLARNKGTQTSTTKTLRNDADDGDIATSAISSDGTTFTRNKWTS